MAISGVKGANDIQADLAQQLLSGPLQEADMAVKVAKTEMQMQLKAQEAAQVQGAVAQLTGVGTRLDAVV